MSQWVDRIANHALWAALQDFGPAIDDAFKRDALSPSSVASLSRLQLVLAYAGRRLASSDSDLLVPANLDGMLTPIQQCTAEVRNFVANGNEGHLNNANNHVDTALRQVAQVPTTSAEIDVAELRQASDRYRNALDANLQAVKARADETSAEFANLRKELAALGSEISNEKQRLLQLTTEHQSQFSSAQENRNKEYSDAQNVRQEKFSSTIAEYSQKLTAQDVEFAKQREAMVRNQSDDLASLKGGFEAAAKDILARTQGHLHDVEKLVGVIGNLGVTSGYQKTALEARNTARVWQAIAVLALLGIIYIAARAFLPLMGGEMHWEGFAARVFLTLTVGVLAGYAISQADKYQQVERRARKLALELEAIGPFLASLPADKQESFRLQIGERSFGTGVDLIDVKANDSPKSVVDVAVTKETRALIMDIIRAARVGDK